MYNCSQEQPGLTGWAAHYFIGRKYMEKEIKRIGVLTSGGDAPGMNAAVRAVVRAALSRGIDCVGIRRGWNGLITSDFVRMDTSRSEERRVGKEC